MRLNPQKCAFGVTFGKLLGHIISHRGIEVDPSKIKAIMEIPHPETEKEIRGFLGRVQYISHFIAKLTMICEPIFKKLKVGEHVMWDDQCQAAFNKIKEVLSFPPVLSPPVAGLPLSLYLTVTDTVMGLCYPRQLTKKKELFTTSVKSS
ncbi:putative mitochondrial protein AtMg00860 [Silene latifolia]|uniref:putative mitochondrial protein AtMg00860 n=1 Tax=Silene latifolia TaxID=37657 RepID=UPI003D77A9C1